MLNPRSDVSRTLMHCPVCSWHGFGAEATAHVKDVLRCPLCGKPVELTTLFGLPVVAMPSHGWADGVPVSSVALPVAVRNPERN